MPHPIHFAAPAEVETPNYRTTWGYRAALASRVRAAINAVVKEIPKPNYDFYNILITRVGANKLDDDNLIAACKPARDEIAAWLGLDDGDERIRFAYDQRQERIPDETPRARRHFRTWLEVTVSEGAAVAPARALGAPARLERERTKAPTREDQDHSKPVWEATLQPRANGTRVCVAIMSDVHGTRVRVCTRFTQQGHLWRTTGIALEMGEVEELGEVLVEALGQAARARSRPGPGAISLGIGTGGGTDTPPKFGRNTEPPFPGPNKPAPARPKHLNPRPPPLPKAKKPPPYPRVRTDED